MPILQNYLHYLGYLISQQGIQPLPEKVTAIKKLKEPNSIDELHHFLGLTGYYRKFTKLFADITKPLNKLCKKDTTFQWSPQCQAAFEHLKIVPCKETILKYPHMEKSYTLFTDASNYAHSGVLN